MFTTTTLLLALSVFASSVSAGCTREYIVKAGDICDSISAAQNVSTYQLAAVNEHIDERCFNLVPGEKLCLGSTPAEDCKETYIVRPNDNCDAIKHAAGLNSTILYTNNPQIDADCQNMYIGQVLCVSKKMTVPPVPASGMPFKAARVSSSAVAAASSAATPTAPASTKKILLVTSTVTAAPTATPTSLVDDGLEDCDDEEFLLDTTGDPADESLPFCDEFEYVN